MKNKQKSKGMVTRLRFPEFKGEWEEKPLNKVAEIIKGRGISKSDIVAKGKTPCIRYGELYTTYREIIEDVVSRTNLTEDNLILSRKGDVLIPSSGETKEEIATCACVQKNGIALGSDLNIIRSTLDGRFLAYYIKGALQNTLAKLAQGDAVVHLYPNQLKNLKIQIPKIKEEQQRIADCLSSLDDLIAAEGRKLEALRAHKKGLMQQLFPREGETVPRLRFPGFRWEWVVKDIEELCEVLNNRRIPISSSDRVPGSYPYYGASGIVDYIDNYIFDERLVLVGEDGAKWGSFEPTAFIAEGKYWVNNHVHVLKPIGVIGTFLTNYLTFLDIGKYITGNAPPKLTLHKLKAIPIPHPTLPEQQRIADCLSSLDDLITAQARKVELLKKHKKGLMQQLFPVMEEAGG